MGHPRRIEPRAVVESCRLDDEGVIFPSTDRIAEPSGLWILRQRAAVGENLPPVVELLEQDDCQGRHTHDLERKRAGKHRVRDAVRQAALTRSADAEIRSTLIVQRFCPWLER